MPGTDTAPHTAQANGITQAYRVRGPRDAEPLVLLHARGADGADWASIAPPWPPGPPDPAVCTPPICADTAAAVAEFLSPAARMPS